MIYLCRDQPSLDRARQALVTLRCDKGQIWRVEVRRWRKSRSIKQNALLRMYEAVVARETGSDPDDIHEFVVSKWCPRVVVQDIEIPMRTHRLDSKQMTTVIDSFRQWASEFLGVVLPLPDEQGWQELAAQADNNQ